ncbi:MAG TPA: hypothetical protein VGR95_23260 [Thermoanaerobaculia bacterium]|jgi:hypothetical protein|nr:hypothetical protein [Thermoanaerobaculia bacterium]
MATKTSKLAGNLVRLSAPPGSKLQAKQVHEAIDQIFRLNGCLACGLLGIDLHINGPDPDPLEIAGFDAQVR